MKRGLLILFLFLTSLCAFAEPIGSDYSAANARRNLSNVPVTTDLTLDNLTVTDVNGVAPLTAAEKSLSIGNSYYAYVATSTNVPITTDWVLASMSASIDADGTFSNSLYTAPATGAYLITAGFLTSSTAFTAGNGFSAKLIINGTPQARICALSQIETTATLQAALNVATVVQLNAGQTIGVGLKSSTSTTLSGSANYNWIAYTRLRGN